MLHKLFMFNFFMSPLTPFEVWAMDLPWPFKHMVFFYLNYGDSLILSIFIIGSLWYLVASNSERKHFVFVTIPQFFLDLFIVIFWMYAESIRSQGGNKAIIYVPAVLSVFMTILSANIIGMIPFSFTTTAQLVPVFTLALAFNIHFFATSLFSKGFGFFLQFVPSGVPIVLVPFITIIEAVSYIIRTFSLSLRLNANMMAGHILLYILLSFTLIAFFVNIGFLGTGVLLSITLATLILEILICVVQAYVFAVLLTVYISDITAPKH